MLKDEIPNHPSIFLQTFCLLNKRFANGNTSVTCFYARRFCVSSGDEVHETMYLILFLFSVSVPPEYPAIFDEKGDQINNKTIGPYSEAENFVLTCRVVGGKAYSSYHITICNTKRSEVITSIDLSFC